MVERANESEERHDDTKTDSPLSPVGRVVEGRKRKKAKIVFPSSPSVGDGTTDDSSSMKRKLIGGNGEERKEAKESVHKTKEDKESHDEFYSPVAVRVLLASRLSLLTLVSCIINSSSMFKRSDTRRSFVCMNLSFLW